METCKEGRLRRLIGAKLKLTIHTAPFKKKEQTHTQGERDEDTMHTRESERQEERLKRTKIQIQTSGMRQ